MTNAALVYERVDNLHVRLPAGWPEAAWLPSQAQAAPEVLPGPVAAGDGVVYRNPKSGQLMIPSGRVMIRFASHVQVKDRGQALAASGYLIAAALDYAPQAAWLTAASRDLAAALQGLAALQALPDVENVEPQWLMARAQRSH